MSFHDVRFPVDIALNSEGGPERRTDIIALVSGHEERNSPWRNSRRRFNAGYGVKSIDDIERVIAFFEARKGRLHSFRFRDPFDYKSCALRDIPAFNDQILGEGDGQRSVFELKKSYGDEAANYMRPITKPVAGTLIVAVDDVIQTSGVDYEVDIAVGAVSFFNVPSADARINAGFLFDIPVRFDTDQLQISLAAFKAGDIPNIPLVEVLD